MDFSRLPDNVFLQIFEYLPTEDRARLGRVNKLFHRMSRLAISGTKCLDLIENRFRKLNVDQLAVILDQCSPNLEWIRFFWYPNGIAAQLATTLANYLCPRLTHLDLGYTPIDSAVFAQLIRNNPSIESLIWDVSNNAGFPDVTCNKLKILKLGNVNDVTIQAMTGRCPNLEELYLITKNVTANILDGFFASTPQIQRIELHLEENQIVFEQDWVNFWNLPLASLIFVVSGGMVAKDATLYKVATSFPHLQQLNMYVVFQPSSGGIATLANLKELEILHLGLSSPIDDNDVGIQELIGCKQLQKLSFWMSIISPATLISLLRGCPHLEYIAIAGINEVETLEEAAVVLGSLSGISKRDITIEFCPMGEVMENFQKFVWESEAVNEAIGSLEQNEGLKVNID